MAESKLNSISDLISISLTDGNISDKEFSVILKEIEKFCKTKADIRTKSVKLASVNNLLDEETEKALIKKAGTRPG